MQSFPRRVVVMDASLVQVEMVAVPALAAMPEVMAARAQLKLKNISTS